MGGYWHRRGGGCLIRNGAVYVNVALVTPELGVGAKNIDVGYH